MRREFNKGQSDGKFLLIFVEESEAKKSFGGPRCRRQDNIKIGRN
jgi:hypothetical protein